MGEVCLIYYVDGIPVPVNITGEVFRGPEIRLIDLDDNIAKNCSWNDTGFSVSNFLGQKAFSALYSGLKSMVQGAIESVTGARMAGFSLDRYHDCCFDRKTHLDVVSTLRRQSDISFFPIDHKTVDERISELCGAPLSCKVKGRAASGYFFIRLVRPRNFADNNPPHRDVWLEYLKDSINVYIPLGGSNELSSLSLVPGSHLWLESDTLRTAKGANVNGIDFTVPSVISMNPVLDMVRPRVTMNQVMIFSPYLIHGGAVNLNDDMTRVSLEMRFWRR
jgi:hypothetical protein